jgi:hypothetical protein
LSGLAVGLAFGVGVGGGGVEADCVGLAEAVCDGAVPSADVDELARGDAAGAEVLLPDVDVTVLALG